MKRLVVVATGAVLFACSRHDNVSSVSHVSSGAASSTPNPALQQHAAAQQAAIMNAAAKRRAEDSPTLSAAPSPAPTRDPELAAELRRRGMGTPSPAPVDR